MVSRRNGRSSGPKRETPPEVTQPSDGIPLAELSQEGRVIGSASPHHAPVDPSIAAVLAVAEADQHEPARQLAAELLETVSTSAIQLHPAEAAELVATAPSDDASNNNGEVVSQQLAPALDDTSAGSEPLHVENALLAEEQTATVQDSAAPAELTASLSLDEVNTPHQRHQTEIDADSQSAVNASAGDQEGLATFETEALDTSLAAAHTAVEANVMLWSYLRAESAAALSHMRALSSASSLTDIMDLQARELSRALGAAQTLGRELAAGAGKLISKLGTPAKGKS